MVAIFNIEKTGRRKFGEGVETIVGNIILLQSGMNIDSSIRKFD